MKFAIVVAKDKNNGIGISGGLPWRLSGDLKHFKQITVGNKTGTDSPRQNAVIMGRKTWDSIPIKHRPLPDRLNIVLSSKKNLDLPMGVIHSTSLDEALIQADQQGCPEVFILGGAKVYDEAMAHQLCETLYITEVDGDFACDTHLKQIPDVFNKEEEGSPITESGITYRFNIYRRTKCSTNTAGTASSICQS